jgi:hypothetical protein
VALGVTLVFFIVFFNVYQGVKEVSPTVLANARMLGMSERQLMRHVYWPSALSWMFSSLHTSVGFAVVGAVVGEYLGAAAGLGYLIQQAEGVFDVAGVFAGMFVLAAFVIVIDTIVSVIEKRLWSGGRLQPTAGLGIRAAGLSFDQRPAKGRAQRRNHARETHPAARRFTRRACPFSALRSRNRKSRSPSAAQVACAICRPCWRINSANIKRPASMST